MIERLAQLTEVFAIDLCAYALMSNHYHLVLRIDTQVLDALTDHDVALRWARLFSGHALVQRYLSGAVMDDAEKAAASEILQEYRAQLWRTTVGHPQIFVDLVGFGVQAMLLFRKEVVAVPS